MALTHGAPDWQPLYQLLIDAFAAGLTVNVEQFIPEITVQVEAGASNIPVELPVGTSVDVSNDIDTAITTTDSSKAPSGVGSVTTIDGKGNIILSDGFEQGTGCWSFTYGTDSFAWVTRRTRKSGLEALAFLFPTYNKTSSFLRRLAFPPCTKIGFEVSFAFTTNAVDITADLQFTFADVQYHAYVKWNGSSGNVTYLDNTNGDAAMTSLYVNSGSTYWNTIKFVIDLDTMKYIKAYLNGKEMVLDMPVYHQVEASYNYLQPKVVVYSKTAAGSNNFVYIDDIILTQE